MYKILVPVDFSEKSEYAVKMAAKIGENIANDPDRPHWHEGDFFGRTFA